MAQRTPVAAGNWKMNTTPSEGVALARELSERLVGVTGVEVVVCPPFTHLAPVRDVLHGWIGVGAQNVSPEPKGAFTGEVSGAMIAELAGYVIIGHSERRQYFHDTDELVQRRLRAALGAGLVPIVCVGETLAERDARQVESVLSRQVQGALAGVDLGEGLILAYEPVWAIGTGRAANGQQANEAMGHIRRVVSQVTANGLAERVRILYGGSVTPENIDEFAAQEHVDGALVGGASLRADSFEQIARRLAAAKVA
jgi:triosephosphate isomerase (TIM)